MNIEECIKILKEFRNYNKFYKEENRDLTITITLEAKESIDKAIERLLTAYEKEKEKNKELKWKHIKEYDRQKYDWVLVKYFDGDYECVPEVAERRNDGKWYTSERQIPFEVKYFFDMQEILEEE